MNVRLVLLGARGNFRAKAAGTLAHSISLALLGIAPLLTLTVSARASVWPTSGWQPVSPWSMGMDSTLLRQAREYALTQGGGSGIITRGGRVVMSWGSATDPYDVKSVTKSIGSMLLDLAVQDGLVQLSDRAQDHLDGFGVPPSSNQSTGWLDDITLGMLATHIAGFEMPGGFIDLVHPPGTTWGYSDGGVNWLADVLTVRYGEDLHSVLAARVLSNLGVPSSQLTWRDNAYRGTTLAGIVRRELGSGIHASVDAMARLGYLHLRRGAWEGTQILSPAFVDAARVPAPEVASLPGADPLSYPDAPRHYGILWWNNGDGAIQGLSTDAYWAWGMGESLILVIPSLDIVAARAGGAWQPNFTSSYSVVAPFFTPIAQSVVGPPSNQAPLVSAGMDRTVTLPQTSAVLNGSAGDDDLPSGILTTSWAKVSGAGEVTFGDASALKSTASFGSAGVYVLRLTASDGTLTASDDVQVTVTASPSPSAHWGFDEGNGTTAQSSADPGYPGTLTNGAQWGEGKIDHSVHLDGVDDHVHVGDPGSGSALDLGPSFTLAAWVRFDALPSTGGARNPRILQKGASAGEAGSYYLSVLTEGSPVLSLRIQFGGVPATRNGSHPFQVSRWYHVAAVKEGTSLRLYVDGAQDGPAHAVPAGAPDAGDGTLYIGESPANSDGSLDGLVDDVRIYAEALTAGEVLALAAPAVTGVPVGEISERRSIDLRVEGVSARPGGAALVIRSPRDGIADLEIFDVQGRRVKRLLIRDPVGAGSTRVLWDGTNETGRYSASGIYVARLRIGSEKAVVRVPVRR
jgi:CubicO group peptidase (beta-lactamase class C family)